MMLGHTEKVVVNPGASVLTKRLVPKPTPREGIELVLGPDRAPFMNLL
jgi:hypothetical protein